MNYKNKNKYGFTLIETIFGIAIFILIVLGVTLFSRNVWVYNEFVGIKINNINNVRQALKTMVAEIRTASSASTGAYPISLATASSLTFYSDIYDNGLKEKIRYFLSGTDLKRGVIIPTGSPLGYTGTETITTLISNVTNTTIFNYYDKNYTGSNTALSMPVDLSLIRLIKMTVTTDPNQNHSPEPDTFTTQVTLRNLKDNL